MQDFYHQQDISLSFFDELSIMRYPSPLPQGDWWYQFFGKLSLRENYKNSLKALVFSSKTHVQKHKKRRFSSLGLIVPPSQILMIHRVLLFAKNLRQPIRLQECCFHLFFCVAKKTDRILAWKFMTGLVRKLNDRPNQFPITNYTGP